MERHHRKPRIWSGCALDRPSFLWELELELELIQTHMTQKPVLRAEVGMRVRCANKASAECIMRGRGIGQNSRKNCKKARHLWVARTPQKQ